MYDYITIKGNSDYSESIGINVLQEVFNDIKGISPRTNASAVAQLGNYKVILQGIMCDSKGNYSFNDDTEFDEINLIEINIPQNAESEFKEEIRHIATELSTKLNWEIDWRE